MSQRAWKESVNPSIFRTHSIAICTNVNQVTTLKTVNKRETKVMWHFLHVPPPTPMREAWKGSAGSSWCCGAVPHIATAYLDGSGLGQSGGGWDQGCMDALYI